MPWRSGSRPDDDDRDRAGRAGSSSFSSLLSLSGGGYVNYSPVDDPPDRVHAAYGAERWERLVAVKRRHDPDNVFRFNHNIPPG